MRNRRKQRKKEDKGKEKKGSEKRINGRGIITTKNRERKRKS